MSAGAILPSSQTSPGRAESMWSRLKKGLNLREPGNGFIVQPKTMMSPGLRNGGTCAENYLNGNAKKVPIGKIGHRDSIKSAQLELANHDHENNLLNSKPMPKKIASPSNSESNKRNVLSLDSSMGRRELRRVAAESGCARRRSQRYGSERSFSSQSSELMVSRNSAPSPGSLQSCSPRSSQPDNRVGSRGLWGKVRQAYAPTATELQDARPLPKLATFTQLWNLIFEIVRDNEMLELDEPDPRLWWRKVFINLRKVHGKAKASSIAEQLMQNPEVLSAIETKLAGMADVDSSPSAHMKNLPKPVIRRVKALKKLQFDMIQMESKFYEEVHQLECKYAELYAPILEKRNEIVSGEVEPTDEQCDWPSDEEDDEEAALAAETKEKLALEDVSAEDIKGVKSFWLIAFKNVDLLASMIQENDEPILEHLTNVKVQFSAEPMGFTLEFHFSPNEYFTDKVLTKSYEMRAEPDEEDPFSFEGPEIVACQGCVINWNKGKNVTVRVIKKKQKHQKSGTTRTITKEEQQDSFFNFFTPPAPELDEEEIDHETEALLQADYEIGHFIRERIVPRAVLFYTGEACEDDEDFEEEEDEDYEDDDEDDDLDPSCNNAGGEGKKECKQQ